VERYDSFDVKPGDVLADKFRVEQVLGVGGMGIVASAWHLELRRRVALKVLLPSALVDSGALERFAREASTVSRMRGEHVVRIFDVGRLPDGGPPYLVMEHLEGEDLESLLTRRGPLEVAEAVGYLMEVCEGIAEAHSLGVIHRDLKPANIFLTKRVDGSSLIKVVDFGIAKHQVGPASKTLTGPLITMGSPQYMSPEQTRAARDVDATTDLWSMGVCLYELLTGLPPFEAPSAAEVSALVLMAEPKSPASLRPEIPARLSEIVLRCMRKRRWERYPDVAALAEALEPFAPESRVGTARRIRLVLDSAPPVERELEPFPATDGGREVAAPLPTETELVAAAPDDGQVSGTKEGLPARRRRRATMVAAGVVGLAAFLLAIGLWREARGRRAALVASPSSSAVAVASAASASASGTAPPEQASEDGPIGLGGTHARAAATSSPGRAGRHRKPATGIARTLPDSDPTPTPATPAPAVAPPEPVAPSAPPRFAVASARVEIGAATNTTGTTAANVNRAIGPLGDTMTACYRAALPQMREPLGGSSTLHIETDEDGVITVARVVGGVTAPGRCIAGSVAGRRLPNVDTGRARADLPLFFKAL
jgi:eukaryotic-like serine/threonine-protein kinase